MNSSYYWFLVINYYQFIINKKKKNMYVFSILKFRYKYRRFSNAQDSHPHYISNKPEHLE